MNYFKAAEQLLSSVPTLEQALDNLTSRLKRLVNSGKPHDLGAVNLEKEFTTVRDANDTLEECLAVVECKKNILDTRRELNEITCVISQLPDEYKNLVNLWYIEKRTRQEILAEMHIESLSTLYALRNKAVAEFALKYYGAAAIPSI